MLELETKNADGGYEATDRDLPADIKDKTQITWSYKPNEGNTYYLAESKEVIAYPLSKFSDHILELCGSDKEQEDTGNGYAVQWEKILKQCVTEFAKLTNDAKISEEVDFIINGQHVLASPNDVLSTYATSYVLSSAVKDLCEKKNDKNPSSCTEKDILTSIEEKKFMEY